MISLPLGVVISIIFIILAVITIIVWFQFMTANRLIERFKKHNNYQPNYNKFILEGLLNDSELEKNEQFQTTLHKLNEKFHKLNEKFSK